MSKTKTHNRTQIMFLPLIFILCRFSLIYHFKTYNIKTWVLSRYLLLNINLLCYVNMLHRNFIIKHNIFVLIIPIKGVLTGGSESWKCHILLACLCHIKYLIKQWKCIYRYMTKFENDQQFNILSSLSKKLSTSLIPITIVLHIILIK